MINIHLNVVKFNFLDLLVLHKNWRVSLSIRFTRGQHYLIFVGVIFFLTTCLPIWIFLKDLS